jgi:hypothetical protein
MNVLEDAARRVRWRQSQVLAHPSVPTLWQFVHPDLAFNEPNLELHPEHHVQVVGRLVCLDTDQRRLDLVDSAVEPLEGYAAELCWKPLFEVRIEVLPEGE